MSNNDNAAQRPETPPQGTGPDLGGRGARRWRTPAIYAGVLACGFALGIGAYAATGPSDPIGLRQGVRLAFVQHMVGRALDSVGASTEQEGKVHDIIAAKFAEIAPNPDEHAALRKQALELLTAPTIDRVAVEKLRVQAVATFDAKSKAVVGGLVDIADQLTPDQRTKLAGEIEAMRQQHHGMMGPWGGWRHDGPMNHGPDNEAN